MLKRILPFFLIITLITGCQLPSGGPSVSVSTPTMTDNEMATKVAQILTSMPSPTPQATQQPPTKTPTATESLPAEEPTATPQPSNTPEPTAEEQGAEPSPTSTVSPEITGDPNDPLTYLGKAAWEDTLDKGTNWVIDEDPFSIGKIDNGHLVMTGKQPLSAWRLAGTDSLTNVYLEALMKMDKCSGKDSQGLMFRVPVLHDANRGYLFGITCDGHYFLNKFDGKVGKFGEMTTLINFTPSTAIKTGANEVNRIGVLMKDKTLTLFINGIGVAEKTDASFTKGYFGIFVKPTSTIPLTTKLDKISYWTDLSKLPADWKPVQQTAPTATPLSPTESATPAPRLPQR